MRELKFKFWLGHTKKMTYEHELKDVGKIIKEFTEDIIPLQFTGLHDKNEKDIYEGDILKTNDGRICFVVWSYTAWVVESPGSQAQDLEYASFYNECEIIGNIHSTPELIK